MLKKILGGFSVLLLVFAIVMPLLVTTNTAYSTPNKKVRLMSKVSAIFFKLC